MTWAEILATRLPVSREAMELGLRFAVEWTQGAADVGIPLTTVFDDLDQYAATMLLCSH